LHQRAAHAAALYMLGDLFEVWLGDDDPDPAHPPVLNALHSLSASVPVYFMHGNRDFLIGATFAQRSGCRLLADPTLIDLDGTPTLLLHGDTLCTDDIAYQDFRRMVRDPAWQRQFLALPIAERAALAANARAESRRQTGAKAEYIMDANPRAVESVMREQGVRRMIHGHTHRPAIHDFDLDGSPARRIVLGDWYEQGSVLSCRDETCVLETLQ
jgi:UDP-2,3-diacylglucosamine hydrolase